MDSLQEHTQNVHKSGVGEGNQSTGIASNKKKTKERPEMPVYRPGNGLLKKGTGKEEKDDSSSSALEAKLSTLAVSDGTSNQGSDSQERRRKKRPEIQVYVPKPKAKLSTESSDKSPQFHDQKPAGASQAVARETPKPAELTTKPEPSKFQTDPQSQEDLRTLLNAKKSYSRNRPVKSEDKPFEKPREEAEFKVPEPVHDRNRNRKSEERSQPRLPSQPQQDRRRNPRTTKHQDDSSRYQLSETSEFTRKADPPKRESPPRCRITESHRQNDQNQRHGGKEHHSHPPRHVNRGPDDKGRQPNSRQRRDGADLSQRSGPRPHWREENKNNSNVPDQEENWDEIPTFKIPAVPTPPVSGTFKPEDASWNLESPSSFYPPSGPASLPLTPASELVPGAKAKKKRRRKGRRASIASSVTSESALSDVESVKSTGGRYRRRSSRDSMASLMERPDSPSLYVRRSSHHPPVPRQASEPPMYVPPLSQQRMDSKPPLPANYHTLPPRLKKRYDSIAGTLPPPQQHQQQQQAPPPQPLMSITLPAEDWDGTSLTFSSKKTTPPSASVQPLPPLMSFQQLQERAPPVGRSQGLHGTQSRGSMPLKGGRGRGMTQLSDPYRHSPVPGALGPEEELDLDIDNFLVRARSQDSLCGIEDRKNNPPSRCSTPSSPGILRPYSRKGADSPVKAAPAAPSPSIKHTHVADWNAEVESSENEAQLQAPPPVRKAPPVSKLATPQSTSAASTVKPVIMYTCSDVRYRNKEEPSNDNQIHMKPSVNPSNPPTSAEKPILGYQPPQQPHLSHGAAPQGLNKGGLLILPQSQPPENVAPMDMSRNQPRKQLYDPNKPSPPQNFHSHPILGPSPPMQQIPTGLPTLHGPQNRGFPSYGEDYGNMNANVAPPPSALSPGAPSWYDPYSESFRSARCDPLLLLDMKRADFELHWILHSPMRQGPVEQWSRVSVIRNFLLSSLETLLKCDIRFCQVENLEQHVWKLAFHQLIEMMRQGYSQQQDVALKEEYKNLLLNLIDEGVTYFTKLLDMLQETYHFQLDHFSGEPDIRPTRNLGHVGLALVSAQKLLIYLGDLSRYREIVCDTTNYAKARSWYVKANNVNPKNGRPYNQLAILALYARRKLDAVYLYMRSLMASNPFQSAKESLISLFDENRKKFEAQERKRREEREAKRKLELQARGDVQERDGAHRVRREIWIHPAGGKRVHRTTSSTEEKALSDNEELTKLPSVEVNKRFVISYLHVQGKLYTKIGMETFHESALLMLREFRTLLQHSPIPLTETRFLQLLVLNMFALDNTQLKDTRVDPGYRSALQEYALIVSLEMFGLILERCISLLQDEILQREETQWSSSAHRRLFREDLQHVLAAVKIWCDWLLSHSSLWNPPPSSSDYHVGPPGDPWTRLATVINLLEKIDTRAIDIQTVPLEGYRRVRLPEDAFLCGFTPLMSCIQEPVYAKLEVDMDVAGDYVRVQRLLYVGRDYLCGLEPPVLKLQRVDAQKAEYVSLVSKNRVQSSISAGIEGVAKNDESTDEDGGDVVLESYSEEEDEGVVDDAAEEVTSSSTTSAQIRELRLRKESLQRKHQKQERRRKRIEAVLRGSVKLEIEVEPRLVVADTNCYIDHLSALRKLVNEGPYTLIVPLIVLAELDGLARGSRSSSVEGPAFARLAFTERDREMPSLRAARVAEAAKQALVFVKERHPRIKCLTTKGTVMPSVTLVQEEDEEQDLKNDDRILKVCLFLCREAGREMDDRDGVRRLRRDVVLLTEDRNLRVKALAQDVPVRDLPDFMAWANLTPVAGTKNMT